MPFFKSPPNWYRYLLGLVAFSPLLGVAFTLVTSIRRSPLEPSIERFMFGTFLAWAFILYFIFDAALSGRVPEPKRRLWCVVLLLAHMAAIPFYWWFYLRPSARGGRLAPG